MAEKKTWKNLENPKDTTVRARMGEETIRKLDKCCEYFNTTRSDIIRKGIDKVFDGIPEK